MATMLQYVLDLFGDAPAAQPEKGQNKVEKQPFAHTKRRHVPTDIVAKEPWVGGFAAPAQPTVQTNEPRVPAPVAAPTAAPATVPLNHPRATRQACLNGCTVGYEFQRARRRTIGFSVGPEGLSVRAPRLTPLGQIDAALQEKAAWIVRKLGEVAQRQQQLQQSKVVWQNGTVIPYLGQPLTVVLVAPAAASRSVPLSASRRGPLPVLLPASLPNSLPAAPASLHIHLPPDASAAQIQSAVQTWLQRQAHALFVQRLNHFAPLLAVQWRSLRLSNAATRWGSASADGSIRLHWRLVHFNLPVIDYVVAHELSHLRFMDHSPRFWNTVHSVVPHYAALRQELKRTPVARWD